MNSKLYTSFLFDSGIYKDAQRLWTNAFNNIIGSRKAEIWVSNKLPNGEEILDGNPIYSIYLPEIKKAVRIIQGPVDRSSPVFSAWLNSVYEDEEDVIELVFSIQLTSNTYDDVLELSSNYLNSTSIKSQLVALNKAYESKFEISQVRRLVNSKPLKNISLKIRNIAKANSPHVITINDLENIYADKLEIISMRNKITIIDFHISNASLNKAVDSIKKALDNIVVVIASENFISKRPNHSSKYEFKTRESSSIFTKLNKGKSILEDEVHNLSRIISREDKVNKRRKSI